MPRPARPAAAIGRIARHEVRRLASAFRPAVLAALALAAVLAALLGPAIAERGLHPDRGLYPVTVAPGSPLAAAAAADLRFRPVEGGLAAGAVLEAGPEGVRHAESAAGRAALRELQEAVRLWQEAELEREADRAAAFPVQVNLVLAPRSPAAAVAPNATATPAAPTGSTTGAPSPPPPGAAPPPSVLDAVAPQAVSVQAAIRPAEVEPPFPVRSLLLTFAFLIPMNLVAQLYAGTLLSDRVRRRALLALTAPHAPRTLLAGRSLPYVAAGAAVLAAAGAATGTGWQGGLAAVPIILFVLAAALVLGLLARSERELTFLLTGATTMLAVFLFLPAIFTALPPVAFLSPVSVVVASMQGEAVGWGPFLYATLPLSLCTLALALVGVALYREETLFSQRPLRDRVLAAMAVRSRTAWHSLAAGVLVVPFAFVLELLVLSLAIPLGLAAALPITLVGVVLVEERLKLAVAAARLRRGGLLRRPDGADARGRRGFLDRSAWVAGAAAGAGFFVGEKLAILLAVVGFGDLPLGGPALRVFGVAGGWWLLAAPLAVHAAAAALAARGLGQARPWPWLAYLAACALHLAYNLLVLWGSSA